MNRCLSCDCYDSDYGCTMPSSDKWYACPIEAEKPENKQEIEKMAQWYAEQNNRKEGV